MAAGKPLLRSILISAGEDIPPGLGPDVDVINAEDVDPDILLELQPLAEPNPAGDEEAPPSSSVPPSPPDEEQSEQEAGIEGIADLGAKAEDLLAKSTDLCGQVVDLLDGMDDDAAGAAGIDDPKEMANQCEDALKDVEDAAKDVAKAVGDEDQEAATEAMGRLQDAHDLIDSVASQLGVGHEEEAPPPNDELAGGVGDWAAGRSM